MDRECQILLVSSKNKIKEKNKTVKYLREYFGRQEINTKETHGGLFTISIYMKLISKLLVDRYKNTLSKSIHQNTGFHLKILKN